MKNNNIPNMITIARVLLIPVFMVLFWVPFAYHYLVAGIVYVVAAVSDIVDGSLARKWGVVSVTGKLLDPIADKALTICAAVSALASGMMWNSAVGAVLLSIIIVREFAVSALRMFAMSSGVVLASDWSGKAKTILTNTALPVIIIGSQWPGIELLSQVTHHLGNALGALAVAVGGCIHYFVANRSLFATAGQGNATDTDKQPNGSQNTDTTSNGQK